MNGMKQNKDLKIILSEGLFGKNIKSTLILYICSFFIISLLALPSLILKNTESFFLMATFFTAIVVISQFVYFSYINDQQRLNSSIKYFLREMPVTNYIFTVLIILVIISNIFLVNELIINIMNFFLSLFWILRISLSVYVYAIGGFIGEIDKSLIKIIKNPDRFNIESKSADEKTPESRESFEH